MTQTEIIESVESCNKIKKLVSILVSKILHAEPID